MLENFGRSTIVVCKQRAKRS